MNPSISDSSTSTTTPARLAVTTKSCRTTCSAETPINKPGAISSPADLPSLLSEFAAAPTPHTNYHIGEMNSIACHGQDGVSNVFGSALWYLDQAMSYSQAGTSGINLFSPATSEATPNWYLGPRNDQSHLLPHAGARQLLAPENENSVPIGSRVACEQVCGRQLRSTSPCGPISL